METTTATGGPARLLPVDDGAPPALPAGATLFDIEARPASGDPTRGPTRGPALALFGDAPAFAETLHVGRPNMPDRAAFLARMETLLDSGRLTNLGPMTQAFETEVARVAGARHCVSTCNATVALELAVHALGMEGDVIVPSFTFVADAHALWRQGVRPVFCDVDPLTHSLDPACIEAAITSRTTGILAVHMWGNRAAARVLEELAERHGLRLLFDAAHAFGCHDADGPRCAGDAEVYSFHATKIAHAFEGGAIVTDDAELARRLRLMINFGFDGEDQVLHLGTNGKMSEPSAAMGLTSLESLDAVIAHNRRNHEAYVTGLAGVPGLRAVSVDAAARHNHHYVVFEVDAAVAGLERDELVAALRYENVIARRYFHPGCHRMAPYAGLFPQAGLTLPVTRALTRRVVVLPTGLSVDTDDVARLTERVRTAIDNAGAVREALRSSRDPRRPSFLDEVSES